MYCKSYQRMSHVPLIAIQVINQLNNNYVKEIVEIYIIYDGIKPIVRMNTDIEIHTSIKIIIIRLMRYTQIEFFFGGHDII